MQKETKLLDKTSNDIHNANDHITSTISQESKSDPISNIHINDKNSSELPSTLDSSANDENKDLPINISKHKIIISSQIPIKEPVLILKSQQNLQQSIYNQLDKGNKLKTNENTNHQLNVETNQQKKLKHSKFRSKNSTRRAPRPSKDTENTYTNNIIINSHADYEVSSLETLASPSSQLKLDDNAAKNSLSSSSISSTNSSQSSPSINTSPSVDKAPLNIQINKLNIIPSSKSIIEKQITKNFPTICKDNQQSKNSDNSENLAINSNNDQSINEGSKTESQKKNYTAQIANKSLQQQQQTKVGVVEFSNEPQQITFKNVQGQKPSSSPQLISQQQQATFQQQPTQLTQIQIMQQQMIQQQMMNQNITNMIMQYNQFQLDELNIKQNIQNIIQKINHPMMQNASVNERNTLKMQKSHLQQNLAIIQQKIKYIKQQIEMINSQQLLFKLSMSGPNGIEQYQMFQNLLKTKSALLDYLSFIDLQIQEIQVNRYTPQILHQMQIEQQKCHQMFDINVNQLTSSLNQNNENNNTNYNNYTYNNNANYSNSNYQNNNNMKKNLNNTTPQVETKGNIKIQIKK